MSSIDRFSATLNTVARANRFEVVFTLPKALPQAFLEMNTSQLSYHEEKTSDEYCF